MPGLPGWKHTAKTTITGLKLCLLQLVLRRLKPSGYPRIGPEKKGVVFQFFSGFFIFYFSVFCALHSQKICVSTYYLAMYLSNVYKRLPAVPGEFFMGLEARGGKRSMLFPCSQHILVIFDGADRARKQGELRGSHSHVCNISWRLLMGWIEPGCQGKPGVSQGIQG